MICVKWSEWRNLVLSVVLSHLQYHVFGETVWHVSLVWLSCLWLHNLSKHVGKAEFFAMSSKVSFSFQGINISGSVRFQN